MSKAKEINKAEFEKLMAEGKPFVADFFATWCGPCQMLIPLYKELSEEVDVPMIMIDIDKEGDLAGSLGVQGVPTLMVFNKGKETNRSVGFIPMEQLKEFVATAK